VIQPAIFDRNESESLTVRITTRGHDFLAQKTGDPYDIGHQDVGLTKHMMIDALHDETAGAALASRVHNKGIVDVTVFAKLGVDDVAIEDELMQDVTAD